MLAQDLSQDSIPAKGASMIDLGYAALTLTVDSVQYQNGINNAVRAADRMAGDTNKALDSVSTQGAQRAFLDLSNIVEQAVGHIIADMIPKLVNGLESVGKAIISSASEYQATQITLESLIARELANGEERERSITTRTNLTAKEREKLEDLRLSLNKMNTEMSEKQERLRQMQEVWKTPDALAVKDAQADIAVWAEKIDDAAAAIAALEGKNGKLVTSTEKFRVGMMSVSDALPEASKRSKELMDELAVISILSPYQSDVIQETFKLAMAFGWGAQDAKIFTKAILDVGAGSGATNERLQRMAYNFAQIRQQGKVTAMDVRQLALAGFDLTRVLQFIGDKYGVVIKDHLDFNKALKSGKLDWDQFIEGFKAYAESNFSGASERLSVSMKGIKSTVSDVFNLITPLAFGPALWKISEHFGKLLGVFLQIRQSGVLQNFGENLAKSSEKSFAPLQRMIDYIVTISKKSQEVRPADYGTATPKTDILRGAVEAGFGATGVAALERFRASLERIKNTFMVLVNVLRFAAGILGRVVDLVRPLTDNIQLSDVVLGVFVLSISAALPYIAGLTVTLITMASPFLLIIAAIAAFRVAWEKDFLGIKTFALPIIAAISDAFKIFIAALTLDFSNIKQPFKELKANVDSVFGKGAADDIIEFTDHLKNFADWIIYYFGIIRQAFNTGGLPAVGRVIETFFKRAIDYVKTNAPKWAEQIGAQVKSIWQVFVDFWQDHGKDMAIRTISAIGGWIRVVASKIGDTLIEWKGIVKTKVGEFWAIFAEWWETEGETLANSAISTVRGWINVVATKIGDKAKEWAAVIGPKIKDLWYTFITWWDTDGSQMVVDALGKIAVWIGKVAIGIGVVVAQIAIPLIRNAAVTLWSNLVTNVFPVVGPKLQEWWNAAVQYVSDNAPAWGERLKAIMATVWMALTTRQTATSTQFTGFGEFIQGIQKFVDDIKPIIAFLDGIFGPAIQRVKDAFAGLAVQFDPLKTKLGELGKAIGPLLELLGVVLAGALIGIADIVTNIFAAAIANVIPIFSGVVDIARGFAQVIDGTLIAAIRMVIKLFSGDLPGAIAAGWAGAQTFRDGLGAIFGGIMEVVGGAVSFIYDVLANVFSDLIPPVGEALVAFKDFLIDKFEGVVQSIKDFLGIASPSTVMIGIATDMIQGLIDGVAGMIQGVIDKMGEVVSGIKGAFGDPLEALKSVGEQLISGLIKGIEQKVSDAVKAIEGAISKVVDAAKKVLDMQSPSKVFASIGSNVIAGMAQGMSGDTSAIEVLANLLNTMINMSSEKATKLNVILKFIGEGLSSIVSALSNIANYTAGAASAKLQSLIDEIRFVLDSFVKMGSNLKGMYFIEGFTKNLKLASEALTYAFAALKSLGTFVVAPNLDQNLVNVRSAVTKLLGLLAQLANDEAFRKVKAVSDKLSMAINVIKGIVELLTLVSKSEIVGISDAQVLIITDSLRRVFGMVWEFSKKYAGLVELSKPFAENSAVIIKSISDIITALTRISETSASDLNVTQSVLDALVATLVSLLTAFKTVAELPIAEFFTVEMAELAKRLSETIAPFSTIIELRNKIMETIDRGNISGSKLRVMISRLAEDLIAVANEMSRLVQNKYVGSIDDETVSLASKLSGLIAPFSAIIDLWEKLGNMKTSIPSLSSITNFVTESIEQYGLIYELLKTGLLSSSSSRNPFVIEKEVLALAANLGGLLEPFNAMLDFWKKLDEMAKAMPTVIRVTSIIDNIATQYRLLYNGLKGLASTSEFSNPIDGSLLRLSENLSGLLTGFREMLDFWKALNDAGSDMPSTSTVQNVVREIIVQYVAIVRQLALAPELLAIDGATSKFGEAVGSVFGGLKSAVEAMRDMLDFTQPSVAVVDRLLSAVRYIYSRMALLASANEDDNSVTSGFATTVGDVFAGLKDAIGVFKEMYDLANIPVASFEWRLSYLINRISRTMQAFKLYAVEASNGDWKVVTGFKSVLSDVFDILSSALKLFAEITATNLPTWDHIDTFINRILYLYSSLKSGIAGIESDISGSMGSISSSALSQSGIASSAISGITKGWKPANSKIAVQDEKLIVIRFEGQPNGVPMSNQQFDMLRSQLFAAVRMRA